MADSTSPFDRRTFVTSAGGATAASLLAAAPAAALAAPSGRRRLALVGTGGRGTGMWGRDLVKRYPDLIEFVGLCDVNPLRAEKGRERMDVTCPTFTSFDEMCDKTRPQMVLVNTVDAFHAEYIVKSLDRGLDVLTEKPMVIDEKQCQAVLEAERRNKRKIVVTFNYRYAPKHQRVKEALMAGDIGKVTSVDFAWFLDTIHGADYFRRWHRLKAKGGSLWVHKATHHFDLMNWWLGADPVEVVARADLKHYGKKGPFRSTNCRPCAHKAKCPYFYDITRNDEHMRLYVAAESADAYHRDGCVFREDVDIYDTMSALVGYSNGVTMNYSLNAFMPYEGYAVAFNGDKGRLEVRDYERQPWTPDSETDIFLTRNFGKRQRLDIPKAEGGHGGGDDRLRDLIFRKIRVPDHMRLPDSRAGALSCLTGIAARTSVEQGRPVKINELIPTRLL